LTEVQQEQDRPAKDLPEAEMPDAEASTENVGAGRTATVGRLLREAREAAGLTAADVAQSLKFSPRQVEQLEADDYDALPGTTIVRGFTRSYARLLGLDSAALLKQLDARTPNVPVEVRPPDNMGLAGEPSGLRQLSLLASAAIVIALAAVLIGLWQYFSPELPAPSASSVVTEKEPAASVSPGEAGTVAAVPAAPVVAQEAVAVPAPGVAPGGSESSAPVAPLLVFSFEDRSWLEVSDAAKQVLHTGESPAGSRIELSGKPPFDVVVGNAGKVRVTYGERVIDLVPHTRAEVARLKIE
jgi:cytoskeleton protein RodZ